jgi:hypothetical protein
MGWLGYLAVALMMAPGANAQGSAQDQYKLNLPNPTGSDQRGQASGSGAAPPGPSQTVANRLAATSGTEPGAVVWVLVVGLAAISCLGGVVAYRRRRTADAFAGNPRTEFDEATLEVDGRQVYVRLQPTDADPLLTIEPLNCNLEGEESGSHQAT